MKKPLVILLSIFVATAVIGLGFRIALALNYIDFSGADTQDIRWPAGQTLSFVQGGSERLRIDATTGNVVIPQGLTVSGTFSMTGTYTGSVSAGNISAGDFGSNYGGGIFSFPGNVGIGTTAPGALLHVVTPNTPGMKKVIFQTSTVDNGMSIGLYATKTHAAQRQWEIASNSILGGDLTFLVSSAYNNDPTYTAADTVLQLTNAGNVGIGTTGPLAKLDIKGNTDSFGGMAKIYLTDSNANAASRNWSIGNGGSAYGNLTFAVSAAKDGVAGDGTATNVMVMQSNGNVGIGTTSPGAKLEIYTGDLRFNKADWVGTQGIIARDTRYIFGYVDHSYTFVRGVDNDATDGVAIQNYAGTNLTYFRNDGNVGIGTTSPGANLHVNSAMTASGNIAHFYAPSLLSNSFAQIQIGKSAAADASAGFGYLNSAIPTAFLTVWGDNPATGQGLYYQRGGNVGIGTTGPGYKLDVVGDINITGSYRINGSAIGAALWASSGANIYNSNSGNVGIGTTSPAVKLDIEGNLKIYNGGGGWSYVLAADGRQLSLGVDNGISLNLTGGNVGIGTSSPVGKVHIFAGGAGGVGWSTGLNIGDATNYTGFIQDGGVSRWRNFGTGGYDWRNSAATSIMFWTDSGNVGIGYTDTAGNKLAVNGAIYSSSSITAASQFCFPGDCRSSWAAVAGGAWTLSGNNLYPNSTSYNVGIGTTGPLAKLHISGAEDGTATYGVDGTRAAIQITNSASGGGSWYLRSGATNNTTPAGGFTIADGAGYVMTLKSYASGGNVGIGTTSPGAKLDVVGDIRLPLGNAYRITTSSGGWQALTSQSSRVVQGYTIPDIQIGADTGDIIFSTATGGSISASERMRILESTGNVGIGTTGPKKLLNVHGAGALESGTGATTITDATVALKLGTTGTRAGAGYYMAGIGFANLWNYAGGSGYDANNHAWIGTYHESTPGSELASLVFATNATTDNVGLPTERMRITSSGNVGIGTTSPVQKLDVNGQINMAQGSWLYVGNANILGADGTNTYLQPQSPSSGVQIRSSAGSNWVTVTNSGNVGIGTTAPSAPSGSGASKVLEISDSADPAFVITDTGTSDAKWGILNSGGNLEFYKQGLGNSFILQTDGDAIINTGNVGIGTTSPAEGKLVVTGGNITSTSNGGGFYHSVAAAGMWGQPDYLRLTNWNDTAKGINIQVSTGNVGIGITSPGYKLDVAGTLNASGEMYRSGQSLDSRYSRKDTTGQWLKPYYEYGSWLTTEVPSTLVSQMGGGGLRVDFLNPSYTANGDWGHVLTWSGYDRYGMWQLSGSYYDSDPRLFFRHDASHTNAWTSWYEVLNSSRHTYAANMNQYVRTSDSPTFAQVYSNSWFRSYSSTGWYNETHGVGLYAADSTWIRAYPASTYFRANYIYQDGPAGYVSSINGTFTTGYVPRADGNYRLTNGIIYDNGTKIGIGTTSPGAKLHVDAGTNASAVYGQTYSSTFNQTAFGYLGYYDSSNGAIYGVYGYNNYTGFGAVTGRNGNGVWGQLALQDYGVYGYAPGGRAIYGNSPNGYGVYGYNSGSSGYGVYCYSGGSALCGGNRSWSSTSDGRLKENIATIQNALQKVTQLRGVTFQWKDGGLDKKVNMGFIAQEVLPIIPEVVTYDTNDIYTMQQGPLTALLVEAIKEQQGQIDNLLAMMGRFTIDENGTLTVKKVVTDELELGGYCVKVKEGKLEAEKGECE